MKKKCFALLLALVMALALAACGGDATPQPGDGDQADAPPVDAASYVVGISQYVTHPALDAATEGFRDALNELLPGQVKFDYQNAAEDIPTCATIATSFVSDGVDLIMANATPALQAAAAATAISGSTWPTKKTYVLCATPTTALVGQTPPPPSARIRRQPPHV